MEDTKQIQKAGDNAQQLQMVNPTFNVGITEQRAREIFSEMNAIARQSYTQDAYELAMKRVGMFEELLMNKVEQVDGMLEAFRDPSFQFLLVEAQKRAAASDREADFEMLTELLAHRIENKDDRKTKASISKAIGIVDQVDDDALCGLTIIYAINACGATTGDISQGLYAMNYLFSTLCYRDLPTSFDWVEHLDILDAVRSSSFGTFKKFKDIYSATFDGYICAGIQKDSKNYARALEILKEIELPTDILVSHELNDGYVRLSVRNKDLLANVQLYTVIQGNGIVKRKVTPQEVEALYKIWDLYSNDTKVIEQVKNAFMEKWDSFDILRQVRIWFEALPHSFSITPIGIVLAHANAQKHNKAIPNLNIM